MTEKKPPLVLVDGSSYLFRAFHAMPPLENSKGNPTEVPERSCSEIMYIDRLMHCEEAYRPVYLKPYSRNLAQPWVSLILSS